MHNLIINLQQENENSHSANHQKDLVQVVYQEDECILLTMQLIDQSITKQGRRKVQ